MHKTVCLSVKLSICSCVNASIRTSILISIHSFIHSYIHPVHPTNFSFFHMSFHSYIHPVHPTNFSFFHMSFHSYIHHVHPTNFFILSYVLSFIYPSCSSIFFFHKFMKIKNIPLGITEGSVLKRRSRQSAADCLTTSSVSLNNTNILSKHTLKLLKRNDFSQCPLPP